MLRLYVMTQVIIEEQKEKPSQGNESKDISHTIKVHKTGEGKK